MAEEVVVVKRNELYPKKATVKEDGCAGINFTEVPGENIEFMGRSVADDVIVLSNYRLCLVRQSRIVINIPVRLIQSVIQADNQQLVVSCKHAASFRIAFSSDEKAQKWMVRLNGKLATPRHHTEVFAYSHWAWAQDLESLCQKNIHLVSSNHLTNGRCKSMAQNREEYHNQLYKEFVRLGYRASSAWRMTNVNNEYKLCKTYPKVHIIPKAIADKDLEESSKFRSSGRFPSIMWRHQGNGVVLARCSQPLLGWFSWRNSQDEKMLKAISEACSLDRKHILSQTQNREKTCEDIEASKAPQLLIVDARSYSAAVANRTKGGGCECKEYYPNCDIKFMNLPNIHAVRNSFHSVCNLCTSSADPSCWLSSIESSQWLQNISLLLQAACHIVKAMDRDCQPVVVHCSDGWDRTPQLTSLAQIMLDPFYRTVPGFTVLVEREWLSFGHKFGSRCGHRIDDCDSSQHSPVFLQWLDCIHQLLLQFPTAFEFNEAFLVKLAVHTYSCLYGTFLYNCAQERGQQMDFTVSVWSLLSHDNQHILNLLYVDLKQVLVPDCHIRCLQLWTSLYCISQCVNPKTAETDQLVTVPSMSGPRCISPASLPTSPVAMGSPVRLTRSKSETSLSGEVVDHFNSSPQPTAPLWDGQLALESASAPSSSPHKGLPPALGNYDPPANTQLPPSYSITVGTRYNPGNNQHRTLESTQSPGVDELSCSEQTSFDSDGLSPVVDPVQKRLCDIALQHRSEVAHHVAETRELRRQLQHLLNVPANDQYDLSTDRDSDEMFISEPVEGPGSFDDSHWEKIHEKDTQAVLWVPDHAATHCFGCNSQFWLAKRRHHCRSCGKLFCYSCSNYYCPVPDEQLYNPVRVCSQCYDKLDGYAYNEGQQQQSTKATA